VRIAGHPSRIEIRRSVTSRAGQTRCPVAVLPAHHQRLMQALAVALPRPLRSQDGSSRSVDAAELCLLPENSAIDRARLVRDARETHNRTQFVARGLTAMPVPRFRRLSVWAPARRDRTRLPPQRDRAPRITPLPLTIGKRRGRCSPRRAMAFATADDRGTARFADACRFLASN